MSTHVNRMGVCGCSCPMRSMSADTTVPTMSEPARVFYEYLGRTFRGSSHGLVNADALGPGTTGRGGAGAEPHPRPE